MPSETDIFGCSTARAGGGPDCPVYTVPRPTVPIPERRPWRSPTGKAPKPKIGCPDNAAHDPACPPPRPPYKHILSTSSRHPIGHSRVCPRRGPHRAQRRYLPAHGLSPIHASRVTLIGREGFGFRGVRTPCMRNRACTRSRADGARAWVEAYGASKGENYS